MKQYKFEVLSNAGDVPEKVGEVWWTGKTIDSDMPKLLKDLQSTYIMDKKFSDGLEFFNLLPLHFRNGYVTLKRTK